MPDFLPDLNLILPRQFERRLYRFPSARSEVNCAAAKSFSRKIQQLLCKFFGDRSRELTAVDKLQLPGLLGHGVANLAHAMPNKIHCRGAREIEVTMAAVVPHVNALAWNGQGIWLEKRPPQNRRAKLLLSHRRIIATGTLRGFFRGFY